MALVEYVRGSSMSDDQLQTGIESGELQAWRVSPDGEQWFKQSKFPEIHGVPLKRVDASAAEEAEMEYEAEAGDDGLKADDEPSVIQKILTDPENEGMLDAAREYLDEYFDD